FLRPKRATVDCNQSRTNPDIGGTGPDHLGPVFCSPHNQKRLVQTGFLVRACKYPSFDQTLRDLMNIRQSYDQNQITSAKDSGKM
ncbi:hypothetical protein K443DRAFT_108947, partial [Laccaria amethystina LaAM-08-1]